MKNRVLNFLFSTLAPSRCFAAPVARPATETARLAPPDNRQRMTAKRLEELLAGDSELGRAFGVNPRAASGENAAVASDSVITRLREENAALEKELDEWFMTGLEGISALAAAHRGLARLRNLLAATEGWLEREREAHAATQRELDVERESVRMAIAG